MPLFELLRLAKAKLESSQEKKSSAPEDDVVELVWENGQISVQNQSIKSRNTQACSTLVPPNAQSNPSRTKEIGNGSDTRPLGGMNGITMPVSSLEPGLNQDDDLVPWLNQPLDGSLQSDFFPDVSEVTVNEQENDVPNQTLFPFFHANNNSDQSLVNSLYVPSHNESSQHGRGTSQSSSSQSNLFQPPPPLYQRGSVMNVAAGNRTVCEESGRFTHDQEPVLPRNKPGLMNFSHFLRPAALAKANLQGLGITSTREMGSISTTSGSSNHMENLFVESDNRLKEGKSSHSPTKVLQTKVVSAQAPEIKVLDQSVASDPVKLVTAGSSFKDNEKGRLISGNSCRRDQQNEKAVEPAVQCSSVCSGNSLEGPSDGPSRSLKRPHSDIQDMDGQSEDVEEESTDARKTAPSRTGSGSKRSRSAEVHNLSERRRRDRINEKMRALQELIPNCNKVDKASMLDEAIEHIKSLQLQVQIMSMSSGYYMPPMMFPPALQPRHVAAHMPHYSAMAMGMSYGMSVPDMSCVSPKIPMVQVPSQFPSLGLQPLAHPSVAMPRIPMSSSAREINGSAVTDTNKVADPSKDSGCKDQKRNKALKPKQSSSCSNVPTKACGSS